MQQTTPRPVAAIVASAVSRRLPQVDQAIADTALGARSPETDRLVPAFDRALNVWNSHADMIDAKFGRGFVGLRIARLLAAKARFRSDRVRSSKVVPIGIVAGRRARSFGLDTPEIDELILAFAKLDDLTRYPLIFPDSKPGVFAWMADCVFTAIVPQSLIQRHSSGRDSLWNKRIRKTKLAGARQRLSFVREQRLSLDDDQGRQSERIFRSNLMKSVRVCEALVRRGRLTDPTLKDVAVDWPHEWRVNRISGAPVGGMYVPLTWEQATEPSPELIPVPVNESVVAELRDGSAILSPDDDDPATE